MYIGLHVNYPLCLSNFSEPRIFWTDFRRILKNQISWKSFQWERVVLCGRTDRQTDTRTDRYDEANSRFS